LKKKIVISDNAGIRIINTESGKSLSIKTNPCPSVLLTILVKVICMADPDSFRKFNKLPLKKNIESKAINSRYRD
jgi:hypothetical protein